QDGSPARQAFRFHPRDRMHRDAKEPENRAIRRSRPPPREGGREDSPPRSSAARICGSKFGEVLETCLQAHSESTYQMHGCIRLSLGFHPARQNRAECEPRRDAVAGSPHKMNESFQYVLLPAALTHLLSSGSPPPTMLRRACCLVLNAGEAEAPQRPSG